MRKFTSEVNWNNTTNPSNNKECFLLEVKFNDWSDYIYSNDKEEIVTIQDRCGHRMNEILYTNFVEHLKEKFGNSILKSKAVKRELKNIYDGIGIAITEFEEEYKTNN